MIFELSILPNHAKHSKKLALYYILTFFYIKLFEFMII